MRQKLLVIASREVRALMRPARLRPMQRTLDHRLRHVEHIRQLKRRRQLRVECTAVVVKSDIREALLQLAELVARPRKRSARTVNAGARLHRLLHLLTDGRNALAATSLVEEL